MADSTVLTLPKTNVRFENGVLQQVDENGNTTLQVPASDLRQLKVGRTIWIFAVVAIANGVNCVWLASDSTHTTTSRIAAIAVGVLAFAVGIYTALQQQLIVETATEKSKIALLDSKEAVQKFISDVKQQTHEFGQTV